jgi:hypothetical protein
LIRPSDPSGLNNPGNVAFDGSSYAQYVLDTIDDNVALWNDMMAPANASAVFPEPPNPNGSGALYTADKEPMQWNGTPGTAGAYGSPNLWTWAYAVYSGVIDGLAGGASAQAALNNLATWTANFPTNRGGYYNLYAYAPCAGPGCLDDNSPQGIVWGDENHISMSYAKSIFTESNIGPGHAGIAPISSVSTATPSPTQRDFQIAGSFGGQTWTPANGDFLYWSSNDFGSSVYGSPGLATDTIYVISDSILDPGPGAPTTNWSGTASISGTTLTISSTSGGSTANINPNGNYVLGAGVPAGESICSGTGDPLVWNVCIPASIASESIGIGTVFDFNLKTCVGVPCTPSSGGSYATPTTLTSTVNGTTGPFMRSNSQLAIGCISYGCVGGYAGIWHSLSGWANAWMSAAALTVPPGLTALWNDTNYRETNTPGEPGVWYVQSGCCGSDARWNMQNHF